jgi:phosphate uptake regulator
MLTATRAAARDFSRSVPGVQRRRNCWEARVPDGAGGWDYLGTFPTERAAEHAAIAERRRRGLRPFRNASDFSSLSEIRAMSGKIKSIHGTTLVLLLDDGTDQTVSLHKNCSATLDGKPAKLTELQLGDHVTLAGDPPTSITATR